mgnify:CR=1 FL=1
MECLKCFDQNYIVKGCCSGHMCGCMGMPTSLTNCIKCNPNNDKEMGENLKNDEVINHLEFIQTKQG